VAIKETIL
jgi:CRP-like cAMP-binding protein